MNKILSRKLGFVWEFFCPTSQRRLVSSKSPEGQKLSRGTTWVGPGDNKDSYPPEGQQFPTWGTKNISTLPRENNKSLFLPEKKKILKHFWAENTGKIVIWPWQEKIRLQPWKKMRNNECNFFVLYVQFLLLFYKKSWWIQFYIKFYVSLVGHFFPPCFPFLLTLFELNWHENVGQKRENPFQWKTF